MKKIIRLLVAVFLVGFFAFYLSVSLYISRQGRDILKKVIKSNINEEVAIGNIRYDFPLGLHAVDVNLGGKLQIREIYGFLKFSSLFDKDKIVFEHVLFVEPALTVYKEGAAQEQGLPVDIAGAEQGKENTLRMNKPPQKLVINKLLVEGGKIDYVNHLGDKSFSVFLNNVHLTMNDIIFPLQKGKNSFVFVADLTQDRLPVAGTHLKAEGWIDYVKKDLDVNVKVFETDGRAGLVAKAVSTDNNMNVSGEVTLNRLTGFERADNVSSVDSLLYGILQKTNMTVGAKFSFVTKMDNFKISKVSFSGSVLTNSGQ